MSVIKIKSVSIETVTNYYEIEADNKEQAIAMIEDGEVDPVDSDVIVDDDITYEVE
jgi:hypothetical protein